MIVWIIIMKHTAAA